MVVPAEVRAALVEHALAERPNESCGLLLLDGDVATRYVPAVNRAASPYRFELYLDPVEWADLNDTELAQAVVHSHLSSPPRPSRTDVENIGQWEGRPYLIYCVASEELAAWTIRDGGYEQLQLRAT
ncbi:MAG TPA: M67 family metallopeptidase [Gaiellaceae bacterium]|nr:M67 family metallopeptidase [Gaiellaceae bacterium]